MSTRPKVMMASKLAACQDAPGLGTVAARFPRRAEEDPGQQRAAGARRELDDPVDDGNDPAHVPPQRESQGCGRAEEVGAYTHTVGRWPTTSGQKRLLSAHIKD